MAKPELSWQPTSRIRYFSSQAGQPATSARHGSSHSSIILPKIQGKAAETELLAQLRRVGSRPIGSLDVFEEPGKRLLLV